jgi:hypothetical protein
MAVSKLEEITQKIIDLLSADTELSGLTFYFGPPFTRQTPFCYVSWAGGPVEAETTEMTVWRHRWHVVVVDSAKQDDVAEKSVMGKIQRVYEVLKGNRTLGGAVRDSRTVQMVGEVVTVGVEWGKVQEIVAGARLTLECEVEAT